MTGLNVDLKKRRKSTSILDIGYRHGGLKKNSWHHGDQRMPRFSVNIYPSFSAESTAAADSKKPESKNGTTTSECEQDMNHQTIVFTEY